LSGTPLGRTNMTALLDYLAGHAFGTIEESFRRRR
jgi:hypothetical protein